MKTLIKTFARSARLIVITTMLSTAVMGAGACYSYAQSDAKMKAVNELMDVMNVQKQMDESAERMFATQAKAMPMVQQYKDVMMDFFTKYINWDTIGPQVKQVYAEQFTTQQLQDLITFMKTDSGQAFARKNPQIMQQIAEISQSIVMEHQAELQQKIMNARQQP